MKSVHNGFIIRPATPADVDSVARVLLTQVTHDGFHDWFFPHQDQYPEDFRDWWWRYCRRLILHPGLMTLVAEVPATGTVVGMAMWSFEPRGSLSPGEGPEPKDLDLAKNSLLETLQRQYVRIADTIHERFHPNRAVDNERNAQWPPIMKEILKKLWTGEDRVCWYTFEVAIDPGFPDASTVWDTLMKWGPDRGRIDGVASFAGAGTQKEVSVLENLGYYKVAPLVIGEAQGWIMKRDREAETKVKW